MFLVFFFLFGLEALVNEESDDQHHDDDGGDANDVAVVRDGGDELLLADLCVAYPADAHKDNVPDGSSKTSVEHEAQ